MRRLSIEKGDAFILVYSASDLASWHEVQHLRQLILDEKQEQQLGGEPAQVAATSPSPPAVRAAPPRVAPQRGHIGSVHAAATQLTAAYRRASCAAASPLTMMPALSNSDNGGTTSRRALGSLSSGNSPEPGQAQLLQTAQRPSMAQYNSQLSRLLQSAPAANTTGKLLQSISIEDKDEEEEEESAPIEEPNLPGVRSSAASSTAGNNQKLATSNVKLSFLEKQKQEESKKVTRTPIVVVANKCDLDASSCQVDTEEAEKVVCEQWGNSFVKCSAKEGLNVDRVFMELLNQARAPEILSQFVIDDHQQRRQSLPVLKNQLSAHHVRGLRNLYQQQLAVAPSSVQQQSSPATSSILNPSPGVPAPPSVHAKTKGSHSDLVRKEQQQQEVAQREATLHSSGHSSSSTDADSQCALM